MKCPNCHTENPETRKFCRECGGKLSHICPQCGYENLTEDKFCGDCGHALEEPEVTSHIDYSQPESYTPKFLADKILTTRSSIEGEHKFVTVLFADVANYTSISEKLDPEEAHQIMDGCFKVLMNEIHKYEGTIDKFTGDGVMALFGAPVAHEDHAQRACYAALAIQRAIKEYSEKIEREYGIELKMRIGLNSGLVVVGAVSNDLRMDYTTLGDTTNLASRMESTASPGTVLVSTDTQKLVKDFFKFDPLGKVNVKGKKESVAIYELIEAAAVDTRIEAAVLKGLTQFAGRQKEMGVLEEAVNKAQSGSGQVVGIVGEAGMGKSRLVLELGGMLPEGEYTYLKGSCLHYGVSVAYLPLLDIVRSYFDLKEGEREFVIKRRMRERINQLDEKIKDILPSLYDVLSLKIEDEDYLKLDPPIRREKTFEAIRDLLIRESQNRPLILAVEDLHWIDKTSEEFLTYLIGWLTNAHILLILLYRPEYTHKWASKSYYSQISVDQLSTKSSSELVQSILKEGEVVPALRDLITARAGGNPLFMEEFTHTLLENGSIQKKDHEYVLSAKASEIQIPDTIQGIIAARMDRLEDNLKSTMQVASVIGKEFAFNILNNITVVGEELKSYLFNLQGLEFIYEKSLFPELEYVFKHVLTQEVAYNSLLASKRKKIHEKIGDAIESLYPDRLEHYYETMAHHYSRSEKLEKALQYLKLSGDKTSQRYSNWESFHFYKEAISVLNKLPDTEENKRRMIEVILLMEGPMRLLAYPEDSLHILREGERLSTELGDESNLALFYSSIGLCYAFKGNPLQGIEYTEKCFNAAEKMQDIELMAPTGFDLCSSYVIAGEYYKTVQVAPKVIALLETSHRESDSFGGPYNFNLYSALSAYYGLSVGLLGDFKKGESLCEKGFRFACDIDNAYSIGFAELMYCWLFTIKGDGENAIQHSQNAIRYAEQGQIIPLLGLARMQLGYGYCLLGELQPALMHLEKGLQIQHDAGFSILLSQYCYCLGMAYFDLGDYEKSLSYTEEALKLAIENKERQVEGSSRILMGRVLGKADPSQSGKAEEFIQQGVKVLDKLKLKPLSSQGYLCLGELYADMGRREKSLETLKKAQSAFQEMGMDYWLRRTQAVLEKLQRSKS